MRSVEGPVLEWINRDGKVQLFALPKHSNMNLPMVEHFVEEIQGNSRYYCPGEEGVLTSRIMEAAYRSAAEG
jgi:predicted dehydrogenase